MAASAVSVIPAFQSGSADALFGVLTGTVHHDESDLAPAADRVDFAKDAAS